MPNLRKSIIVVLPEMEDGSGTRGERSLSASVAAGGFSLGASKGKASEEAVGLPIKVAEPPAAGGLAPPAVATEPPRSGSPANLSIVSTVFL